MWESDTGSRFWRFDIETFITIVDIDRIWDIYLVKKIVYKHEMRFINIMDNWQIKYFCELYNFQIGFKDGQYNQDSPTS